MEKRENAVKLTFNCSPLVLEQLDALVGEYGYRSRGELLRAWIEKALHKQRINPAVLTEIEQDHNLLGAPRPRRRPNLQSRFGPGGGNTIRAEEPMPSAGQEGNAPDGSGSTNAPTDGPSVA